MPNRRTALLLLTDPADPLARAVSQLQRGRHAGHVVKSSAGSEEIDRLIAVGRKVLRSSAEFPAFVERNGGSLPEGI